MTREEAIDTLENIILSEGIIDFSPDVAENIVKKGTDSNYGARPLRRAVTTHIEDVFAEKFLSGELEKGSHYKVTWSDKLEILKK